MSTKNEQQLDSDIAPERQKLKEAVGETDELIGYGVMYTVGGDWNCIVPRDWLLQRVEDLGIPEVVLPTEVSPKYAYNRAMTRLEDELDTYWVEAPRLDQVTVSENHQVDVRIKEGDGDVQHVHAEVFFTEEETKQEGGSWDDHHLGVIDYDSERQAAVAHKDEELGDDDLLSDVWEDVSEEAKRLQKRMQEVHIARDVRNMMHYTTRDYTNNVIQLRRSVYLFPAGMMDFIDKMSQLFDEIDEQYKESGDTVAIRTFEVLDTDEKREWVESRVEQTLEDNVGTLIEEAMDDFDEGETASQVVSEIREGLSDDMETAAMYNGLLEAEIAIEEVLAKQKAQLAEDDHEEIVEQVMEKSYLEDS